MNTLINIRLLGSALLLAIAPTLTATADTATDRFGFKGIALGSNLAHLASNPKYDCRVVTTPISDTVCSLHAREKETIAGASIDSVFYFYDPTGLTGITINLPETGFQPVITALSQKYGTPSLKTETVKNLKGKTYENRTYRWTRPQATLHAERYAGRIDKSVIRYVDETAAQRNQERRATLKKNPGQDL